MKQMRTFLFFCMVFVANSVFSQKKPYTAQQVSPEGFATNRILTSHKSVYAYFSSVPGNFYSSNLGFFCRQELRLASVTRIPIKFRIGSLAYCDWMEGKRHAGTLPAR